MEQNRTDYSAYIPRTVEKLICIFAGGIVSGMTGFVFYENWILTIVAAAIGAFFALKLYRKTKVEKRKMTLLLQFRDMLGSLSSSLSTGANIQNAFQSAEADMTLLHGEDSAISLELRVINCGINGNLTIEQLLNDFGKRSGIEDVESFACVFETCFRLGGNIKEIVNGTCLVICDKIDTQQEITTVVTAKRTEQNAMLVMPVFFVLVLKGLGAGVADLTSARGIISTTIAITLFVIAYFIGKRVLKIEL